MISCGNSNLPAATRTCRHVALSNLFFQFFVTYVTFNIGSIANVLPYSLKLLKLVFSERDAFSYCTLQRAVKFNASRTTNVPRLAAGLVQLQLKCRLLSLSWIKMSAVIGDSTSKISSPATKSTSFSLLLLWKTVPL